MKVLVDERDYLSIRALGVELGVAIDGDVVVSTMVLMISKCPVALLNTEEL